MSIFVSASSLADFISCETKAYYRIFEPQEAIPTREMLMGTITHKVLEKSWEDKDKALGLADRLCEKDKIDAIGRNSVVHFIETYFENFRGLVDKGDSIEKRFKVKMYDDVFLVGVLDRVSGGVVYDWKTNANPPKNIDGNVQFILYDLAYKMIYDKEAEGLYLASLKDGSLVRYKDSPQHQVALIGQIIPEFVKAVREKKFVKNGLFNSSCYRCQYKVPCLGEYNGLVR